MRFEEQAMLMAARKKGATTGGTGQRGRGSSKPQPARSFEERAMNAALNKADDDDEDDEQNYNTTQPRGRLFPMTTSSSSPHGARSQSPPKRQTTTTTTTRPVATRPPALATRFTEKKSPPKPIRVASISPRAAVPLTNTFSPQTTTTTQHSIVTSWIHKIWPIARRLMLFAIVFALLSLFLHEILNAISGKPMSMPSNMNDMKALVVRDALTTATAETREFVNALVTSQPDAARRYGGNINDMQVSVLWSSYQDERAANQRLTVVVGGLLGVLLGLLVGGGRT